MRKRSMRRAGTDTTYDRYLLCLQYISPVRQPRTDHHEDERDEQEDAAGRGEEEEEKEEEEEEAGSATRATLPGATKRGTEDSGMTDAELAIEEHMHVYNFREGHFVREDARQLVALSTAARRSEAWLSSGSDNVVSSLITREDDDNDDNGHRRRLLTSRDLAHTFHLRHKLDKTAGAASISRAKTVVAKRKRSGEAHPDNMVESCRRNEDCGSTYYCTIMHE